MLPLAPPLRRASGGFQEIGARERTLRAHRRRRMNATMTATNTDEAPLPTGPGLPVPPMNAVVRIDRSWLRVIGHTASNLILTGLKPPHHLYLMGGADGVPRLPSFDEWSELEVRGRAELLPHAPHETSTTTGTVAKMIAQCDLLDAAQVLNGAKAIAIWLDRNWSPDLIERFGEPDSPHTIRRWRSRRRASPPG